MDRCFIIAEAGVNHNGSVETARKMVDAAIDSGADAVKFQTFNAVKMISRFAPKAEYQKKTTAADESQLSMVKRLEIDKNGYKMLIDYCNEKGIIFISSPFDLESIDMLDELGLAIFKIPSGEITNLPYLRKVGSLNKRIIMSTGMADLGEIEDALDIITEAGTKREDITVLHCNTEYPTPMDDVNLTAMLTIKEAMKVIIGYSDHTSGIEVPIAAAALGATVIEKHFTLDKDDEGPDSQASIEPDELQAMVRAIRGIEKALGDGIKRPSLSESKNKLMVRKSIVASRYIRKGDIFTEENITVKRPETGISPMKWDEIIGKRAIRDFKEDEMIKVNEV
ncbi:MAG: N-acetylneuraminate synthase [Nitrospirota bacterium]